jgi:hypothetical protein
VDEEVLQDLTLHVERRANRLNARLDDGTDDQSQEELAGVFVRLQRELLSAELDEAIKLRDSGRINDETLRRIQRDLDVELIRLERI